MLKDADVRKAIITQQADLIKNIASEKIETSKNFQDDIDSLTKHKHFLDLPSEQRDNLQKILQICAARITFNNILSEFYLTSPTDVLIKRLKKQYDKDYSPSEITKSLRKDLSKRALQDARLYRNTIRLLQSAIITNSKHHKQIIALLDLFVMLFHKTRCIQADFLTACNNRAPGKEASLAVSFAEELELTPTQEILELMLSLFDSHTADILKAIGQYTTNNGTLKTKEFHAFLQEERGWVIQESNEQLKTIEQSTFKKGEKRKKELAKLKNFKQSLTAIEKRLNQLQSGEKLDDSPKMFIYEFFHSSKKFLDERNKHAQLIADYAREPVNIVVNNHWITFYPCAISETQQSKNTDSSVPIPASSATTTDSARADDTHQPAPDIETKSATEAHAIADAQPPIPKEMSTSTVLAPDPAEARDTAATPGINPELKSKVEQLTATIPDTSESKRRGELEKAGSRPPILVQYTNLASTDNFASTHGGLGKGHIQTLEDLFDDGNLDEKIPLTELFNVITAAGGSVVKAGGSGKRYLLNNVMRDIQATLPLHARHRPRSDSRDKMADYITVMQFREFFKAVGLTQYLGQYHKELAKMALR